MFTLPDLEDAHHQIHAAFPGTPQYAWPLLTERLGTELWVKHENYTPTGAFKVRGGLIYVARVATEGRARRGLITATRGNHGQSLAYAGRRHGVPLTIVVPHGNSSEKNAAMRALGSRLIEHGADFDAARQEAVRLAEQEGLKYAPSFHPDLVIGVATWALELFQEAGEIDVLYVPIGLGSGICGAIQVRDLLELRTEIVGVQSTGAPAYALSLAAGRVVETETAQTLADGIAVRIPDSGAFEMIRRGVARIVTVTDEAIAEAVRVYWTDTHNLAEGAGAAALAAALQEREQLKGKRVGVPLCGGNIDLDLFRRWVARAPPP